MEKKVRDTQSFNLSQMPAGSISKVVAVRGGGRIAQRLMEMGVVPGVSVKVIKSAPFGDPIEIRLLGYSLAIRRNEASAIEVEG
ncbi:MAG: ferrous iron transport protein A [Blastocatellia bacterium]|nr:ferrous iron transport protein A [Chloracidobacterium sp.]MBL8183597.1 ferrous iron transport protein A [Blastocatellia bacterium]HBE81693.1 hypothetical protein [Blastocatellia bacterium]HRJ89575.1 ferrous iron transport protein A [Pyrinomonadaceae bacterium]HRK50784.1 ferrous iron transport protein A [Pyrinomonadaceae bacterium]